jgi:hypothetical protein
MIDKLPKPGTSITKLLTAATDESLADFTTRIRQRKKDEIILTQLSNEGLRILFNLETSRVRIKQIEGSAVELYTRHTADHELPDFHSGMCEQYNYDLLDQYRLYLRYKQYTQELEALLWMIVRWQTGEYHINNSYADFAIENGCVVVVRIRQILECGSRCEPGDQFLGSINTGQSAAWVQELFGHKKPAAVQ